MEVVENNFFQLLVNLLLLPQYNIPLSFDCRRVQLGVLKDVADNVNSLRHILLEALGIVDSLFSRCVGVEMGTNVLNLELQSVLGATAGTLEGHVLKEVGGSVGCISLRPGTSIYPDTDGSCLSMGMRLCSDGEAIRKSSRFGGGGEVGRCRERPQWSSLSVA